MAISPLPLNDPSAPVATPAPGLFDGNLAGAPDPLAVDTGNQILAPDVLSPPNDVVSPLGEEPATPDLNVIDADPVDAAGEGEQYAGILSKILTAAAPPVRRLDDATREGTGVAAEIGKYTVIREADEVEVQAYFDSVGKTSGAPSPTKAQREAGIPTAEFNLENIDGPDELKAAIDNVAEMWRAQGRAAGRDKMSFDEIQGLGEQMGFGPTVNRLLKRAQGDTMKAEEISASLQALATSGVELNRLAKIASTSTDAQDLLRFRQHMAFHAAISIQMKGAQMEAARALAAFRIPRSMNQNQNTDAVIAMMDEFGGDKSVRDMAKDFLALDNAGARNRFSSSAYDKVKGAWFEMWINGLLSSPSTQMANIMGNTIFQIAQIPERAVAGVIGTVRAALGSKSDRVRLTETAVDFYGMIQGIGDGFRIAGEAWRTEAPVRDLMGKVESARHRAVTSANLMPEGPEFLQWGIDYLGATIRLPGRALMTADEFFKAVAYRRELNSLAVRRALKMKENGSSRDDIAEAMDDILTGKDADITNAAEEFAQYATFTNPVHGKMGELGAFVQGSIVGRMLVPFFRTPVNIFKAGMERSPYGFVMAIQNAKDPIKRDMLIARASLGTGAMAYTVNAAGEGRITGSGPSDHILRQQLESLGWQKYSFASVKDGVENPRWIQVGHMMILHPDDVTYSSYERMEPVSMILAIGADVSQRFYWPTADDETVMDIAMSSMDVIFDYMKDQTFLQGFSNIAKILSATRGEDMAEAVARMSQTLIGSQVPFSSALASIERVQDPMMEHIIPDRSEPLGLRTLYSGLKRLQDRLPLVEGEGPILRNRFYMPRLSKNADVLSVLLPPMVADILGDNERTIEADPVMMAVVAAGVPLKMPSRKIEGVALTAEEYERYLEFANFPPDEGAPAFYEALASFVLTKEFQALSVPEQQTMIQTEDSAYKTDAREYLLEDERFADEFADLRQRVSHNKSLRDTYGRQIQ